MAANALAGAGSLIFFPADTARLFFWEIKPPINAALFGALFLGGAAAVALITYRGPWEPARFLVPSWFCRCPDLPDHPATPRSLYSGPAVGLLARHLRRGAIVGPAVLRATRAFGGELGGLSAGDPGYRAVSPSRWGHAVLLGVLVLIRPAPVVAQWPWPITPLMVRIFASWFAAFGVGLLWFWVERDWERVRHVADLMIAAAGLDLLMVFVHRQDLTTVGPSLWLYCFHLGLVRPDRPAHAPGCSTRASGQRSPAATGSPPHARCWLGRADTDKHAEPEVHDASTAGEWGESRGSRSHQGWKPRQTGVEQADTVQCSSRSVPRSEHAPHMTATQQERDGPSPRRQETRTSY